ncbi:hypothetical protein BD324DRAFT_623312 [Kockovaella imperatae]|uniref:Mitochondrial distribution and morphology protein 34 n=1 Tax=Kockovaella imperatae TaxID=4999 RepID=A0A1Y1UI98_9TREE|nr:hypothetical protein BD324DRAFT_623312 [Kockovaella imperatae]ORX37781.1 hypothetical protein BD324DRAFT_623312 [Kockovaella imperatae]
MSFQFPDWSTAFSPDFHESAKAMLEGALNKGNKPPVIQGRIEVVDMSMGTVPPVLTLLEIGDLSLDRFRGILRLGYQGDAWIEVRCRVQANPLSHNPNLSSSTLPLAAPLLASQPLLVPMTLRLSRLHLRAILILVVSQSKGITLVFKNDPLQNVDVSSTFDSVEVIRGYLQQEIEGQLREMFREDLPGIIHRLSQRWFTGTGVGGKVELPYKDPDYAPTIIEDDDESQIFPPPVPTPIITPKRSTQRASRKSLTAESPTSYTVFPGIEEYDPTYGLRPEGVPTHSGYEAFGRLWEKARGTGLGALVDSRGDVSDFEEEESFDMFEMETALESVAPPSEDDQWETFPAVGGGLITRPRIYHSQSQIRAPSEAGQAQSPSGAGSITARASSVASSTVGSLCIPPSFARGPPSLRRFATQSDVFHSDPFLAPPLPHSQSFQANAPTKPRPARPASIAGTSPGKSTLPRGFTLPLNNTVSQLATLSHSAHTLSPYARGHEHIAVRSFPHLGKSMSTASGSTASAPDVAHGPVKARRKRIFQVRRESG